MGNYKKTLTHDGFVTERIAVHENGLLGDYDKSGRYFITDNIKQELLKVKKVKKYTFNNSMFCISNELELGEITFELHFEKKAVKGKAKAYLYILENVYKVNGYYSDTIKTLIGEFQDKVEGFVDNTYKHFNITLNDEDEGRALNLKDLQYPYIIAKKQLEAAVFRNIKKDMYEAYEDYFKDKMEILKEQDNSYATAVIDEYNKEYKTAHDRFLTTDSHNNYKAYSELLDKAIESREGVKEKEKEMSESYHKSLTESVKELNKQYESKLEDATKKLKKQLSKDNYNKAVEIKQEVDKRNETVKPISCWGLGYDDVLIDLPDTDRDIDKDIIDNNIVNTRDNGSDLRSAKDLKAKMKNLKAKTKKIAEDKKSKDNEVARKDDAKVDKDKNRKTDNNTDGHIESNDNELDR